MNTYVGYVSWELIEEDLKHAFEGLGEDQLGTIIKDTGSGESRAFGFVEMPAKAEATSAIKGPEVMSLVGFLDWMTKIKFLIGLVFVILSFTLGKIALPVFPINSDISLYMYTMSWVMLIGGIAMCGKEGLYISKSLYKKYGVRVIKCLKKPKS